MNEQAIQDSYNVFVSNGYTKSIDDFKKLISTNPTALKDSYDVFVSNGYGKSIDDYKSLMGVKSQESTPIVKKKITSELPSQDGSLVSQKTTKIPEITQKGFEQAMAKRTDIPTDMSGKPLPVPSKEKIAKSIPEKIAASFPIKEQKKEETSYLENLGTNIEAGLTDVSKMITSIPETVYNVFSIPQNAIAYVTGLDISANAEKFKKNTGITNPILDHYKAEGKRLEKEISEFNQDRYKSSSIYENVKDGNYQDAFELLGSGIARSAPTSIAIMAGGATLSTAELAAVSTGAFYNENLEQLQEDNPDASDIENNIKALGMSAAESVFSSIGQGQIGAVYRDIVRKEGLEVGQKVFKDGLVEMYKGALAKYGVPIGLLGEGIEESATQITQNMISGKPAFEGAADAFILGGGSGVMFTAPISLKNAKDRIKNKIVEVGDNKKINEILADGEESFSKVFDVSKDSEINEKQLKITSLEKSRELLLKDLERGVKKGDITTEQAKQSLYVFDKTRQITGQLRNVDIDEKSKVKVANLLKEREFLSDKMNGKDSALSVLEKQRVAEINSEIESVILKSKEDAVQEQTTDESVLRTEQPELGLQEMGEGNAQPQGAPSEKETITTPQPEEVAKDYKLPIDSDVNTMSVVENDGKFLIGNYTEGTETENPTLKSIFDLKDNPLLFNTKEEAQAKLDEIKNSELKPVEEVLLNEPIVEGSPVMPEDFNIATEATPEGTTAIPKVEVSEILTLDTNEATNLERVKSVLDSWENDLDKFGRETAGMNIALPVAKAIVKTLKVLVNTGITLEQAIKQASQKHNVTPEQITQAIQDIAVSTQNVSEGVSEFELPGYNRMIEKAEAIVEEKKRGRKEAEMHDAVMGYVTGSKVYEDATDVQRERLVRDVRKRFGLKEKSAPSVAKLFGTLKDVTKITMTEKAALVKQIRDLGRGAKDAVRAWRIASEQLSMDIKEMQGSGKITKGQATNVIRAFSKVNIFSEKSVDRFTTYMARVFEKADYANKLNQAKKTRADIKKLSKNKDKNANLRDLSFKFGKIDPSLVEDIDGYNVLATQIKNATDGSKVRGQKVKFAETVNISDAIEYTNAQIEAQNKILRNERLAELKEIYGVNGFNFTDEEINSLLQDDKPLSKKDNDIVMATIKKAFSVYSTIMQDFIKNGVDVFTGEDVSFTKQEKEIINKFISMDLNRMTAKNALQAVDALANFIENKSIAKMAATIATYTGDTNAEAIAKKGVRAVRLRKLFSPQFGAFLAEQTTTLPMVFEKMFKGFNRGGIVMDAMGLTKLINKKSFAETQANNIVADYVKEFYGKSKPNGEDFSTAYNNTERGMAAFMLRNIIGTEQEMEAEFNRRKGLVEQSIEALAQGNEQQKKKSELYQKAYDKVVANSKNIQDIKDNTDSKNLEAIDYWHKQWESKFDKLSDVASGIYNKVLDKDLNYSPDKYSTLKPTKEVDLLNDESAFINNTNKPLYNKKTGVLMDVSRSNKLPLNNNKKPMSYVDFSFDKNNSNSMYDALVDIETAEPIRQIQAFLKSDSYRKIIPDSDNADMLEQRISTYVKNIRRKNPFSNDEFSKTIKGLNKIANLGVGQALGGITQPIKQVVPVAFNTMINGKGMALKSSLSPDFQVWLNKTGYAIANRGIQSQANIDNLNKLIEDASKSKGAALLKKIEKANEILLKWFLEKPDVFIAKASWKTYYENSLKEQGKYGEGVDYSSHEVNEVAANYAQRMVDRQQNISDPELAGNMFTDKNSKSQVLGKIFMPFASFRMNQASRLATDLSVLGHWSVSTAEDKKIAALSLSSFAVEMAVFKILSAGVGIALGAIANAWMDKEETEEEKLKRKSSIIKGQVTGAVTDLISPLPIFDKMLQTGAAKFLEGVQEGLDVSEEDKISLYSSKPEDFLKNAGLYGIAPDRAVELFKLIKLSTTGKYVDDFGKENTISEDSQENLKMLIGPSILGNVGLAPSEVAGIIRNSIKTAKKDSEETISKTKLKKTNPAMYERLYKEDSAESRIKEREKEMKSRIKEREDRLK